MYLSISLQSILSPGSYLAPFSIPCLATCLHLSCLNASSTTYIKKNDRPKVRSFKSLIRQTHTTHRLIRTNNNNTKNLGHMLGITA